MPNRAIKILLFLANDCHPHMRDKIIRNNAQDTIKDISSIFQAA